ncbi:hypothetical protein HMPREF3182_00758 [Megasphaera hutchinsoni]|uniref:Uncharacterized protein n=1 Tax=Megasphaera hutchinsoni TaxID=1588748 RepID=A0A134CHP6_9FIRM|nr:hypothetical protein HMPREF3182_00758 [Megasphaera hutchinsoni]
MQYIYYILIYKYIKIKMIIKIINIFNMYIGSGMDISCRERSSYE